MYSFSWKIWRKISEGNIFCTSENTLNCGRASQETSWIPIRHVHGSLPNPRCHRLFESYSVPQEKLSHARTRLRQVLSNQGRDLVVLQQFAKRAMRAIFGSGPRQSLTRKDLEGRLIFERVRALSLLYLVYFAIFAANYNGYKYYKYFYLFLCYIFSCFFFKSRPKFFIFWREI